MEMLHQAAYPQRKDITQHPVHVWTCVMLYSDAGTRVTARGAIEKISEDEIKQWREFAFAPEPTHLAERAAIYFPFEGRDQKNWDEAWRNQGQLSYREPSSRMGDLNLFSTATSGVKGAALDVRVLRPGQKASCRMWGDFAMDTDLESALFNVDSLTVCGWIRPDPMLLNGVIFSTPNMIVGYEAGRLSFEFTGNRQKFTSDEISAVPGEWIFFGVAFGEGILRFYEGGKEQTVSALGIRNVGDSSIGKGKGGGNLWLGNVQNYQAGVRPFVGMMDELRIFSGKAEPGGQALTLDELEAVRLYDLQTKETE